MRAGERIEYFLRWGAYVAQIATVFLLLWGYVYTVRPLYQKELVSEELAKTTLALNDARAELKSTTQISVEAQVKLKSVNDEISTNRNTLAQLTNQRKNLTGEVERLQLLTRALTTERDEVSTDLKAREHDLSKERWNHFIDTVQSFIWFESLRSCRSPQPTEKTEEKVRDVSLPLPPIPCNLYAAALKVVNQLAPTSKDAMGRPLEIPEELLAEYKRQALSHFRDNEREFQPSLDAKDVVDRLDRARTEINAPNTNFDARLMVAYGVTKELLRLSSEAEQADQKRIEKVIEELRAKWPRGPDA